MHTDEARLAEGSPPLLDWFLIVHKPGFWYGLGFKDPCCKVNFATTLRWSLSAHSISTTHLLKSFLSGQQWHKWTWLFVNYGDECLCLSSWPKPESLQILDSGPSFSHTCANHYSADTRRALADPFGSCYCVYLWWNSTLSIHLTFLVGNQFLC